MVSINEVMSILRHKGLGKDPNSERSYKKVSHDLASLQVKELKHLSKIVLNRPLCTMFLDAKRYLDRVLRQN